MDTDKLLNLDGDENKKVDITVNVDVSKIVRNAAFAGVMIVGIIFSFQTYKKYLEWKRD